VANDDEKVLSQGEVDKLVALVPNKPRPAAAATATVTEAIAPAPAPAADIPPVRINIPVAEKAPEPVITQVRTAAPPPAYSTSPQTNTVVSAQAAPSKDIATLKETVADLTRQVSILMDATARLDFMDEKIDHLASLMNNQESGESPATLQQIAEIQAQLRRMARELRPQQELRKHFHCENCQTTGNVAFLTKCTSCGKERWFGWWPKKKEPNNNKH
jgi:hypothetical protein